MVKCGSFITCALTQKNGENVFGRLRKNGQYIHKSSRPTLLGRYEIILDGKTIFYILKRSFKARLIWLCVKPGTGLTVTVPKYYNLKNLSGFLKSNSAWIIRHLNKRFDQIPALPQMTAHPTSTMSYLGKYITVMQERKNTGPSAVRLEQNGLVVSLNPSSNKHFLGELEKWCRDQVSSLLQPRVERFSQQMGLSYNRVFIRNQKSRWASCSYRKNLNFNWRLVMVPESVLDYVVVHELCHLKEMNHSKAFWNLVGHYCVDWREHRKWLDNHCEELKVSFTNLTPVVKSSEFIFRSI